MSMARMDKWIPGVSPDDRTSDVAGRTLRFRLAAVQHYLPRAAEKPAEDIEYVHELRVATANAVLPKLSHRDRNQPSEAGMCRTTRCLQAACFHGLDLVLSSHSRPNPCLGYSLLSLSGSL